MELNNKDKKILYELDINSRQSNKKIAKSVKLSKSAVNYRIKKLIENKIIAGFSADLDLAKFGYTIYKIYLQFQNMTKEIEENVYRYLVNHPAGIWVASCDGRYDAIFTFEAKNLVEFEEIKNEVLSKFSKYILNKQIIVNIRYYLYSRKWLVNDFKTISRKPFGGLPSEINLDKTDLQILNKLADNGRASILEIAKSARTSCPQIIHRIKKLIEKEVLISFTTKLDLKRLGYQYCKALVYSQNISPDRKKEFVEHCANHRNIIAVVEIIGPWDIELEFEVQNFEEYSAIMSSLRKRFPDIVRNYESIIITRETGRLYKV